MIFFILEQYIILMDWWDLLIVINSWIKIDLSIKIFFNETMNYLTITVEQLHKPLFDTIESIRFDITKLYDITDTTH